MKRKDQLSEFGIPEPENPFMRVAIEEALRGIKHGHGGPFGAVVVKDGRIIACGHNRVLKNNDATCHGEVAAIRNAGRKLKTHDLSGCEIYTTGEPCPMCLCACLWANIKKIYYGCTINDNENIGFRDEDMDDIYGGRGAFSDFLHCIDRDSCLKLFDAYNKMNAEKY